MISKREGLMLYWCEGDKFAENRTYKVAVTITDATLLKLFVDWLEQYYGVDREKIRLRLHLWNGAHEDEAKRYWSDRLNIPIRNFTKTWIKGKGGRKKSHPYGVFRASISSKNLFNRIINDIEQEFG